MIRTLLWQEEKKFFMRRKMVGILFMICFIVLGYMILEVNTSWIGERYTAGDYCAALSEVKKVPKQKRDAYFEKMEQEQTNSKINQLAFWELESDWRNVKEYSDYLKQIKEVEERGSWYEEEESAYEKKEKKYVKAQYQNLSDKKVTFIGAKGIEKILQTDFCDIAFVFLLLFSVLGLISMEYEDGVQELLNSTGMGRKRIALAKYLAGCLLFLAFFFLIYGAKVVIYGRAYTFLGWNEVIQSVNGYAGATFGGSIREYVLLFFELKCIAAFLIYTIFFFLACLCKKSYKMLAATMCFLLCGILNEFWIKETSYLVNWKRLYPLKGLDTAYMLRSFYTINIFGVPKSYVHVMLFMEIFLLILLYVGIFLYYGKVGIIKQQMFFKENILSHIYRKIKSKSLFAWELRKSWWGQAGIVFLFLLLLGTFFSYRPITETLVTDTDIHYKSYVLKGQKYSLSQAKVFFQKEQKRMEQEEADIKKNGMKYSGQAYSLISNDIKKKPAVKKVLQYISYLEKRSDTKMVYEKGYQMLFGKNIPGGYLYLCNAFAVFMMVMLTIPLWGMEEWSGMHVVLGTTKIGDTKIRRKKMLVVFLDACIVFCILYGSWCFNVSHTYVLSGRNASIQSIRCFSSLPSQITINMFCIFYYGMHFVYLVIVGIGTKWIQKYFHSFVLSGVISYLFFMIPYLFGK